MSKCSSCRGTGKVKDRYGDDIVCSTCDGTGHIINKQSCSKCRGTVEEKKLVERVADQAMWIADNL